MENHPGNHPQSPGQPTYPSAPQVVYLQPGQQAVYLQPQPGQQTATPAPGYNQGQWVYQQPYGQTPVLAPSSGWRIAAGILGIGVGFWNMTVFFSVSVGFGIFTMGMAGFLVYIHLVGGLATVVLGIMLIVKNRHRSKLVPAMLLGASIGLGLVDMILAVMGWRLGFAIVSILGSLSVVALSNYVLTAEAAAAHRK